MLGILWFFGYLSHDQQPTGEQTVDEQIAALDDTEAALRNILQHVEQQRTEITSRQEVINDLSKQESSIKSFIDTNREKVDRILDAAEQRSASSDRKWFWFGVLVSFIIGLGANAAFHFIMRRFQRSDSDDDSAESESAT